MQDFKPNSHRYKEEQKESGGEEKKKVEKVIAGTAKVKKKNSISKFADIFISEDATNVKSYVFMDVLVPAIKKAISDIVTDGIDMILYGGTGHSKKRSSSSGASYVSYRSFSDRKDDHRYERTNVSSRYSFDDIILDSKGEAEEVLDRMEELIDTYGMVTVADLYDLVGITCNYTDNKYGWTSIHNAEAVRVRDGNSYGYMLKLPKVMVIK